MRHVSQNVNQNVYGTGLTFGKIDPLEQALMRLAAGSIQSLMVRLGTSPVIPRFDRLASQRSRDPRSTSPWRVYERTIPVWDQDWPARLGLSRLRASRSGDPSEPPPNCGASGRRIGRSRPAPPLPRFHATSASNFLSRGMVSPIQTRTLDETPNAL
jgi:hypothetical protein